jgi:hypothetical protein
MTTKRSNRGSTGTKPPANQARALVTEIVTFVRHLLAAWLIADGLPDNAAVNVNELTEYTTNEAGHPEYVQVYVPIRIDGQQPALLDALRIKLETFDSSP